MRKRLSAVLVLLFVVGVGQAGENDIIERLEKAGVWVSRYEIRGEKDVLAVLFPGPLDEKPDLAELCELRRLRFLSLRGMDLTDAEMHRVGSLTGLTELTLDDTNFPEAGLDELAGLSSLCRLHLNGCSGVTDASINSIARLKSLRSVVLFRTGVTEEGAARLRKALPECRVLR